LGQITSPANPSNGGISTSNNKLWFQVYYVPPTGGAGYDINKQQGLIEGGSLQASTFVPDLNIDQAINSVELPPNNILRTYSPAYHLETLNNPNITITANNRLVFRSDRLPTSDITEVYGNTSFSLHLNDNWWIYNSCNVK
jgi:hypothetical protein